MTSPEPPSTELPSFPAAPQFPPVPPAPQSAEADSQMATNLKQSGSHLLTSTNHTNSISYGNASIGSLPSVPNALDATNAAESPRSATSPASASLKTFKSPRIPSFEDSDKSDEERIPNSGTFVASLTSMRRSLLGQVQPQGVVMPKASPELDEIMRGTEHALEDFVPYCEGDFEHGVLEVKGEMGKWILPALAPAHRIVDLLRRVLAFLDVLWTPFMVSFQSINYALVFSPGARKTELVLHIVYLLVMLIDFRTTQVDKMRGIEIVELPDIRQRVMRSGTFCLEVIAILSYVVTAASLFLRLPLDTDLYRTGMAEDINEVFDLTLSWFWTLVALLRVLKASSFFNDVPVSLQSGSDFVAWKYIRQMAFLFLFALTVSHLMTCGWFACATSIRNPGDIAPALELWRRRVNSLSYDSNGYSIIEKWDFSSYYTSALMEGTLLLCTVSAPQVLIGSQGQRVFIILAAPVGALYMAYVFSQLLSFVHSLTILKARQEETLTLVRAATKRLLVPKNLQQRITQYHRFLSGFYNEEAQQVLNHRLSKNLLIELRLFLFRKLIVAVAFFREMQPQMINMALLAFKECVFSPGDIIISKGAVCDGLYFVVKGLCEVRLDRSPESQVAIKSSGSIFGEIALVSEENARRTAWVIAQSFTVVAFLSRPHFNEILALASEEEQTKIRHSILGKDVHAPSSPSASQSADAVWSSVENDPNLEALAVKRRTSRVSDSGMSAISIKGLKEYSAESDLNLESSSPKRRLSGISLKSSMSARSGISMKSEAKSVATEAMSPSNSLVLKNSVIKMPSTATSNSDAYPYQKTEDAARRFTDSALLVDEEGLKALREKYEKSRSRHKIMKEKLKKVMSSFVTRSSRVGTYSGVSTPRLSSPRSDNNPSMSTQPTRSNSGDTKPRRSSLKRSSSFTVAPMDESTTSIQSDSVLNGTAAEDPSTSPKSRSRKNSRSRGKRHSGADAHVPQIVGMAGMRPRLAPLKTDGLHGISLAAGGAADPPLVHSDFGSGCENLHEHPELVHLLGKLVGVVAQLAPLVRQASPTVTSSPDVSKPQFVPRDQMEREMHAELAHLRLATDQFNGNASAVSSRLAKDQINSNTSPMSKGSGARGSGGSGSRSESRGNSFELS